MAHPGGRPSKYDPKFVDMVDEYLQTTGRENTSLPTKQGFALYIGVDVDTLNNWANELDENNERTHPELFGALSKLMTVQAKQLIDDGIYGGKEVNSTIVKLLLQNNHGMKDRVDNTTNNKDLQMVSLDTKPAQDEQPTD